MRTSSASVRMATPSSRPNSFDTRSGVSRNEKNTEDMISAAATITRPTPAMPSRTDVERVVAVHVLLADPAHQEHLVVHREAEQDREGDRGHEALDRAGAVEPDHAHAVAELHHQRERAEADQRRVSVVSAALIAMTSERNAIASTRKVIADDVEQEPRRREKMRLPMSVNAAFEPDT